MKTKVMRLKLDPNKRILITSDIHGGVDILKRLLEKVNFSQNDYLFILGDLIERGPKSLETVRYVIKLVSCGNTFVLKGNNDSLADEIKKLQQQIKDKATLSVEQVQTYTTIGGTPHLEGQYTVFGEVEEGLEIVEKIQQAQTSRSDRPTTDISITATLME